MIIKNNKIPKIVLSKYKFLCNKSLDSFLAYIIVAYF